MESFDLVPIFMTITTFFLCCTGVAIAYDASPALGIVAALSLIAIGVRLFITA